MIHALEEPCWVAGGDDGQHYGDEDSALCGAEGRGLAPEAVRELPYRCLVAECDGDGCGEQFSDEEYPVTHFEPGTAPDTERYLRDFEWAVLPDGRVFCGDEPEAQPQDHQREEEI